MDDRIYEQQNSNVKQMLKSKFLIVNNVLICLTPNIKTASFGTSLFKDEIAILRFTQDKLCGVYPEPVEGLLAMTTFQVKQ
jgi:hypothetical protein